MEGADRLQMAFPPLLQALHQQQTWLRRLVHAVLAGEPIPVPDATAWEWYDGEGAQVAARLDDIELKRTWGALGALRGAFVVDAAQCVVACSARAPHAADLLDRLLGMGVSALELVVAASLREITLALVGRERELVGRYESGVLDAARIGRLAVRVADRAILSADANFAALLGRTADSLEGADICSLLGHEVWADLSSCTTSDGTVRASCRVSRADGSALSLEVVAYREGEGAAGLLQCFVVNSSEARQVAEQQRLLSTAIEASDQVVLITGAEQQIVYVNAAFARMTGYDAAEVLGRNPRFLQGAATSQATRVSLREAIAKGGQVHAEVLNYRKSAEPYWVDLSIVPVREANGAITHWISIQRDITARKAQEQEATRLAMEDYLTGLPNRRAAETRLQIEWSRARREGSAFAVTLVDIDRFKLVNDQYGHQTGDQALVHIASALAQNMRGGDWIGRWGGEEFLVCFHDLDARGALVAGERVRKLVRGKPLRLPQAELPLTVSIGISLYAADSESLDAMLASADALLYQAKQSGRDKVLCAGVSQGRRRGLVWEGAQVQNALREGRVMAAFQPIVDLRTGAIVGEEALARIVGAGNAPIPAQRFIQAAEQLHLVTAIDRAVSRRALERVAHAGGNNGQARFINLSTQFLCDAEEVGALLDLAHELGLAGNGNPLVIEITERHTADLAALQRHLRPLLAEGFRLALDDFGSGYGSFMYLTELPMSFVRIEGWMVARIAADARIRQLIETIVNAAGRFELKTVAECVEDSASAQVLCDLGVDWAQGHFFARPQLAA